MFLLRGFKKKYNSIYWPHESINNTKSNPGRNNIGRLNQMHSIVATVKKSITPIIVKIPKTNANEIKKRNNGLILKKRKKEVIEP